MRVNQPRQTNRQPGDAAMTRKSAPKAKAKTAAKTMTSVGGESAVMRQEMRVPRKRPVRSPIEEGFAMVEKLWAQLKTHEADEKAAQDEFDQLEPDRPEALYVRDGESYLPTFCGQFSAEVDLREKGLSQLLILVEKGGDSTSQSRYRAARARDIIDTYKRWNLKKQKLRELTGLEIASLRRQNSEECFTKMLQEVRDAEAATIREIAMQSICLSHVVDLDDAAVASIRRLVDLAGLETTLPLN